MLSCTWRCLMTWHDAASADRAAQGRVDDTDAAAIERRLLVFRCETRPLLDFYRERRLLRSVDADRPVDDVTDAIFAALADAVA